MSFRYNEERLITQARRTRTMRLIAFFYGQLVAWSSDGSTPKSQQ